MHTKFITLLITPLLLLSAPSPARADWLITPHIGGNFGADSVDTRTNFGISAGWMGAGIVGFEFDASWVPNFFEVGDDASSLVTDSSLSTYMVNAIFGIPVGGQQGTGVRPYGLFGVGAIRTSAESDLGLVDAANTDFGWNAAGGVIGFLSDSVGLRGDVRYFRAFQNELGDGPLAEDLGQFAFWRLSGGVVFRWGGR